jgi:hypothetical protein
MSSDETSSVSIGAVASFHLVRHASRLQAMRHLAFGRRAIAAAPGVTFWRLLGTGAGGSTGPGADLGRTALFAIWRSESDLDRFVAGYATNTREHWHVRLRVRGGHGSWKGHPVLTAIDEARSVDGPVAIITRAHVRVSRWRRFRAAGPAVDVELQAADGLLAVVGVGEAPVGNLGTFSLWRSAADAVAFARRQPQHLDVVRRTRDEGWYGEELFARFEPFGSAGSWDGRDPLA